MIEIGAFKYYHETKDIIGPANYMKERGNELIDKINCGKDELLNNTAHYSPSPAVAVLVRLQTDYASWLGIKQMEAVFDR